MQFSDEKLTRQQQIREGFRAGGGDEVDYEQVLAKIGFGKTQWILLLISGLMTLHSMSGQQSIGLIAIASQCEFEMSQAEKGVMMAACVAGIFLSTYFWGYVSDAIGRRKLLLYSTLAASVFQLVSMFVTNIWVFNFINLLVGICFGGTSGTLYAYLSEFNTAKHRPVVINYSTMFVSVTAIYVPATAWLVLSADWSVTFFEGFVFQPWRLIILLSLLPGIIAYLLLLPFPESPKLLLAKERDEEAIDAVEWICNFNTGRSVSSVLQVSDYRLQPEELADQLCTHRRGCGMLVSIWRATAPLLHKPHGKNFIISAVAVFGLFFSSSGLQIWYPEIVNRSSGDFAGNSSTVCEILDASFERQALNTNLTEPQICDDSISTKTYVDNIILGAAFLLGFLIQGTLLNPVGRKNVLLTALAIAAISGILLHLVEDTTTLVILFCLYILMPGLSISIMLGALVDLVPTHLRGKAVSICLTLGRLGIIVAANLIGVMLEPLCNTTFGMFTASMFICGLLVYFLPI